MKKNFTLIFSAFLLSMTAQAQNAEQLIDNYQLQRSGNNVEYKFVQTINDEKDQTQRVFTQRTFQGIPVYNSYTTYLVKNNQVVSALASENFNSQLKSAAVTPTLTSQQVLQNIAQSEGLKLITNESSDEFGVHFTKDDTSELVYFINDQKEAILSYTLSYRLFNEKQNDVIHVVVDAKNGTIIDKHNTTLSCSFDHGAFHNENLAHFNKADWDWLYDDGNNVASAQYNIYKLPIEAPNRGDRSIVNLSISNTTASPNGWHNVADGTIKTRTEGNNVRAVRDHNSTAYNTFNSIANTVTINNNDYADAGESLNFDFPVDFSLNPFKNWQAATTNLFYMNNMMHDILYNYGFTEVNGNFQKDNYGKGATGNDDVVALAQTRFNEGVLNNATFATPADGKSPRMAMYLWNPPANVDTDPLTINSPSTIAGKYSVFFSPFGAELPTTALTKDLALLRKSETEGNEFDGCGTIINTAEIADKIAVAYKGGSCNYVTKAKNAQNAGAKALIIINNIGGNFTITGNDSSITIPVVGLTRINGDKIKNELINGTTVNASLQHKDIPYADGSFDNGIIAHEYGHGVSNRLTGPITNSNCLGNLEQMGEGWSDFFALMLTQLPGDTGSTKRGIGTFATSQSVDGNGIRPTPYSTDMTVNPAKYSFLKSYGNNDSPHRTGYVWASMIWDMNWKLIDKYGFSPDLYNGKAGNNMALQLVMTGLKLQTCSPGFVDGRDAILMADEQLYEGANKCEIWEAFANRGLGYSASQGSVFSRIDGTEAFDMPPADVLNCDLSTSDLKESSLQMYPNPAKDMVYIMDKSIKNDIKVDIVDMTGKVVSTKTVKFDGQKGSVETNNLPKGVYILKFKTDQGTVTKKLIKN